MAIASVAAAGLIYSVAAGERAQSQQRDSRRRTQRAQDEALRIQMIERQRTVQNEMRSDRPTPASTIDPTPEMLQATDLTGGVPQRLRLGRRSTLGGV
jgi:hypothetical protein